MTKKMVLLGMVFCSIFLFSIKGKAVADVANFDDEASPFIQNGNVGGNYILEGYGGLNWSNFARVRLGGSGATSSGGPGYITGIVSPSRAAFNAYGDPAVVSSDELFTFNGAYLTGAFIDGLSVNVKGLNGGLEVYNTTVVVNTIAATWFDFNYLNIDSLQFTSFSGDVNDPLYVQNGHQFVMDNFTYNMAAVPEPGTFIMLGSGLLGLLVVSRKRAFKVNGKYANDNINILVRC